MTLILTPSLSQTHFCKSDNCGISKVTRDSDLICQILTMGRITTPLLNLIMTLITLVTNSSLSGRLYLHKSISFLFTLITILVIGNLNNGVVIRPTDFILLDENPVYANQISEFIQSV
jgi:hypothetical protein